MLQQDLKIVILGNSMVGKTSLLNRYVYDTFQDDYEKIQSLGASYRRMNVQIKDSMSFSIGIWDTAGTPRYSSMAEMYYRDAMAAIVCYDMADSTTISKARHWASQLNIFQHDCKIYFCATKKDLCVNNMAPYPALDIMETYANDLRAKMFITSSKTGENVAELFHEVVNGCYSRYLHNLKLLQREQRKRSRIFKLLSCHK